MFRLRSENSLRLFKICLSFFCIELFGLALICLCLTRTINTYRASIAPGAINLELIQNVLKNLAEEQSVTSLYVLTSDVDLLPNYKQKEFLIHNKILIDLKEIESNLGYSEELKQVFHDADSLCHHIFSQIDIAMDLRTNNSKELAERYISKDMMNSFSEAKANFSKLMSFIARDLDSAQEDMKGFVNITRLVVELVIVVLIITFVCLTIVCISLTEKLEENRDNLEKEVNKKTSEIVAKNRHLQYVQEQTILGMSTIIESRDTETGEHVRRTSLYVELLAKAARSYGYFPEILTEHYIDILKKVAPMHDIGKIAVSDIILQKPGKLTAEEFEKMKIHTIFGEKIIKEVLGKIESDEYVKMAIDVAKGHHERWDGSGYPNNLKGEEIPLCARIMAVADVFDALVSPRCYKKAFSPERAFEIIKESSGSHFDPILADLFIKEKEEVLKIMNCC